MEENQNLFAKVENTPMEQYLLVSKMKELGTWDPCLASVDIGFLGVTISYVTLSCSQYLYKTFIHWDSVRAEGLAPEKETNLV